jgi:predicted SnoaL-like aldol condensation-catalyzing enzyme
MIDLQTETTMERQVVLKVLTHLGNGNINDATACFAQKFQFNDRGIGLEFNDRERLAEFFQKTREFYPDSSLQTVRILVSSDYVTTQWILHTVLTEPFFGALSRKVPISLHGASIIRIENGKVSEWSDYYDGLTSRRTALAAQFEEWVEL